jgi:divalent metal cation (Fe/Co/Zn/Cd) transporter
MKRLSLKKLEQEFEYDYYMYIPLSIIFNSCIGSIAAMTILAQGTTLLTGIELTLCVSLCMGYNAALLAGTNRKMAFWLLVVSLVVNTLLILITLL